MEIRYLKLIKAIVEEGSITRAMDVLYLSQSALSYQLKELEAQIGTRLFFRVNRKLILTPAGEKLYNAAIHILAEIVQVEDEIKRLIGGEGGTVRISTECYTSYHWLPAVLKNFNNKYPNINIELIFEATHQPIKKLLSGELDLAVTSNPQEQGYIEFIPLFSDEMFVLVSVDHPWAEKLYVLPEDFQDVTLIIHSLPLSTVSIYRVLLSPRDLKPKKLIVMPLSEAMVELVKADMGVVVMANWAITPYLNEQLVAVRINPEGFHRQQYIARIRNRTFPVYFDYLIKLIREEMQLRL